MYTRHVKLDLAHHVKMSSWRVYQWTSLQAHKNLNGADSVAMERICCLLRSMSVGSGALAGLFHIGLPRRLGLYMWRTCAGTAVYGQVNKLQLPLDR